MMLHNTSVACRPDLPVASRPSLTTETPIARLGAHVGVLVEDRHLRPGWPHFSRDIKTLPEHFSESIDVDEQWMYTDQDE